MKLTLGPLRVERLIAASWLLFPASCSRPGSADLAPTGSDTRGSFLTASVAASSSNSSANNSAVLNSQNTTLNLTIANTAARSAIDIQSFVDQAYKSGAKSVTIPPGTYVIKAPAAGQPHLLFDGYKDFKIHAVGVKFIYASQTNDGLVFRRADHVQLDGLTVDYQTVGFSQGQIIAVDPNGQFLDVAVDAGYPANLDDPAYFPATPAVYVFDAATNQLQVGAGDYYPTGVTRLSANTFRYHLSNGNGHAVVGNLFATRGVFTEATRIEGSSYVSLSNYTIFGGGFGIIESTGDGHHSYSNVTVTVGPQPLGAKRQRLISTTADALHSDSVRHGPTVDQCLFEGMTDDGINVHGRYALASAVNASTVTVVTQQDNFLMVGDRLRVIGPTGAQKGTAVVTAVAASSKGAPVVNSYFTGAIYTVVTLDSSAAVIVSGDMLMDVDAGGKEFQIRNSIFRNNRARSIMVKADGGVVSGNTFDGSSMYGMLVDPEMGWGEAGYVSNLTIENNTFKRLGRDPDLAYTALRIGAETSSLAHRHITVENNVFADNYSSDLSVQAAQDVTIRRNSFSGKSPSIQSSAAVLSATPVISLREADEVTIASNTFPAGQISVAQNQAVTNVHSDVDLTLIYQASAGFSSVQGANNWRYQYATLGHNDFKDFSSYGSSGWWQTSAMNWAYGGFFAGGRVDTGYLADPVLTFVAPLSGSATINMAGGSISMPAMLSAYSDGALVTVTLNNVQIWPAPGTSALVTPAQPLTFAPLHVALRGGDILRFRTNMNKNSSSDDVYWDPLIALMAKPVTTVYQSSANFSGVQGSSVWRYQFATVGRNDYTDFNNFSYLGWWQNAGRNWTYGGFFSGGRVDTGTDFDPVLTFVAPASGTATVTLAGGTASIYIGYLGYTDGVALSLTHNDQQIWPAQGWTYVAPGQPATFAPLQVTLQAGDRLYFRTNKYLYSASDDVSWDPIVSFVN